MLVACVFDVERSNTTVCGSRNQNLGAALRSRRSRAHLAEAPHFAVLAGVCDVRREILGVFDSEEKHSSNNAHLVFSEWFEHESLVEITDPSRFEHGELIHLFLVRMRNGWIK